MTTTLEPILAEHPFFAGLEARYVELMTGCASNVKFNAGETIFRTGEEANRFYIIRRGDIALEIPDPVRGRIVIQSIHEGEVLGWSWLVPPYRWEFDARATTLVRALALDGACLRGKCEANHDLGYELLKRVAQVMADRLASARLQLVDLFGKARTAERT